MKKPKPNSMGVVIADPVCKPRNISVAKIRKAAREISSREATIDDILLYEALGEQAYLRSKKPRKK